MRPRDKVAPNGCTRAVFNELRVAPATTAELAAITGYPMRSVSAILNQNYQRGHLTRTEHHDGRSGWKFLYDLVRAP